MRGLWEIQNCQHIKRIHIVLSFVTPSRPTKRVLENINFGTASQSEQCTIHDISKKHTTTLETLPPIVRCVRS